MTRFRLTVLGSPQLTRDDQVLQFSTRKELALVIYLALERHSHTRQHLARLLWPESEEQQARTSLRVALQRLRDALGEPSSRDESASSLLSLQGNGLALNPAATLEVDVEQLQAAWLLTRQIPQMRLDMSAISAEASSLRAQLEAALAVVRGSFLERFVVRDAAPFEDWTRTQREHWQRCIVELCERLSSLQEREGAVAAALETARRWLALDPLNEAAARQLMRQHLALGNRHLALQVYEGLVERLASELRAQPEAETVRQAEQLRQAAVMPGRQSSAATAEPQVPAFLVSTPLVGREVEMGLLIERYQRARSGQAQVVLLEGEAGIGKSRLVRDFLRWASAHEGDVLSGRAFEVGGRLPYQPLIDALRPRLDLENAPEDLLADVWLAELGRLLPELRERYPDLPAPSQEEQQARPQLFEAVTRLLQAWAARRLLVLWIDDVQWADVASLDLLQFVAEHLPRRAVPFLLLLSHRSEERNASTELASWTRALSRMEVASRVSLVPLSQQATVQFVQQLPRQESRPEVVVQVGQWLYQQGKGIPFYLLELLKGLVEGDMVRAGSGKDERQLLDLGRLLTLVQQGQVEVPATARAVIRERLVRLSPAARALLQAGAVLDQWSTFPTLVAVAGLSEQEGLTALDEALEHRFLQEHRHRWGQRMRVLYLFGHDLQRQVVAQEIGAARRRIFHRRAFDVLTGGEVPAAERARHALEAGLEHEAFHWNVVAGDEALAVFGVQDAIAFYEQARALLGSLTVEQTKTETSERTQMQHLFLQLGSAYELLQQLDEAREVYEELCTYGRQWQDHALCARALNHLVRVLAQNVANLPQVRAFLRDARQAAERSGDEALLKETLWNEYQQGGASWDQEALAAWGEQSIVRMQEVQHWLTIAQSLAGFAYDNPQMTAWEQARASVEQAIALYQQQGQTELEALAWVLLGGAQIQQDELAETIASFQQAEALSLQYGTLTGQTIATGSLAYALMLKGDYEEAWRQTHETVANARRIGLIPLLEGDLFMLGDILLIFGQSERARQAYQEGLAMSERLDVSGDIELLASRLCILWAQQGDWSEALMAARQAQAVRDERVLPIYLAPSWHETEVWLRAGERAEAEREIARLQRRLGGNRRQRISLLRSQAVLARWDGKGEEALSHLQEAASIAQAIGLPGDLWQIQEELSELYEQLGHPEQARVAFNQAAQILENLAERIQDETLRAQFLATEPVRRVLERAIA